jgi:hypothetical protein
VKDAAEAAKYATAFKKIGELRNSGAKPEDHLDKDMIARIDRIGAKFNEALGLLTTRPDTLKANEKNDKLGVHWGVQLDGAVMKSCSVKEFDCDIMKVIGIALSRNLEGQLLEDKKLSGTINGKPHAHDVSWRRLDESNKLDNNGMVSIVDALDEPMKGICIMNYYNAPTATTDPLGNTLTPCQSGFNRTPQQLIATQIVPSAKGALKTEVVMMELPSGMAKTLGMMPGFVFKKLMRGLVETPIKNTAEMVKSPGVDGQIKADYRDEFLAQLKQRIAAKS